MNRDKKRRVIAQEQQRVENAKLRVCEAMSWHRQGRKIYALMILIERMIDLRLALMIREED